MAFDPSKIKKTFSIDDLPEGASRSDKVMALAEHLHERGMTASLSAAKRLAEGMVETEQKVIDEGSEKKRDRSARKAFQKSELYKEIGGTRQLDVPDDFQDFIDRAKNAKYEEVPGPEREVPRRPDVQETVMYDEAPAHRARGMQPGERQEVEEAQEEWKVPASEDDEGYEKTEVDASDDGVVVRHTERTAQEETVREEGVVKDEPEERAPEEDIDLFDIFKG